MFLWNGGSHRLFWGFKFASFCIFALIIHLFLRGPEYASATLVLDMTVVMIVYYAVAALFMPDSIRESGFLSFLWKNTIAGKILICLIFAMSLPTYTLPYNLWGISFVVPLEDDFHFPVPTDKEMNLLTRVVYGEARGENEADQANIVHSVLNRASDQKRRYGGSISDILLKKNAYTCLNPNDPNYSKLLSLSSSSKEYQEIYSVVRRTVISRMNGGEDPTQGATHYHTAGVNPTWNTSAKKMIKLGSHKFWIGVDD